MMFFHVTKGTTNDESVWESKLRLLFSLIQPEAFKDEIFESISAERTLSQSDVLSNGIWDL